MSTVIELLTEATKIHADRPMITAGRQTLTYSQVWDIALRAADAISEAAPAAALVGFFCNRDETAYTAIVSILAAGKGYVPLNPKLPDERLRRIMEIAGIDTVVIGKDLGTRAIELFKGIERPMRAVGLAPVGDELAALPNLKVETQAKVLARAPAQPQRPASAESTAYLLFTSGSTGEPKGVPVSNGNLCAYLGYICDLYSYGPDDVHSQTFELTFDLSVHDMMCAWTTGGRLVRFAGAELMSPANILRKQGVTSWFSVPSLGSIMSRTGALKDGSLPSLRVSLFCGEAMPAVLAEEWQCAAPGSIVENLYGPTEATIAFTRYRWDSGSAADARRGLMPIGSAFDGQRTAIIDDNQQIVSRGAKGMLLLGGSQVTGEYWKAPNLTAERYIRLNDDPSQLWYITGDLVEEDQNGCIHFIGRVDNQIKFRGHRIELAEIEDSLRKVANNNLAVVVPWPVDGREIKGITAVVSGGGCPDTILAGLRRTLPDYMVPHRVQFFDELPYSLSGKIDRNKIIQMLGATIAS